MRKRGEEHHKTRLKEGAIQAIRKLYWVNNAPQKQLAEQFGTTQTTISEIVNYKYWSHVPDVFDAAEIIRKETA